MVDILKFPKLENKEFLQDGDDLLRFTPDGQLDPLQDRSLNHMQKSNDAHAFREMPNDWSNQELAHLFRVKHLLNAAGIYNEIERGITDEGDPWCVFCNAQEDIFIHLCRIDGVYLLDSPNIDAPLLGRSFSEIIEAFTHRKLLSKDDAHPVTENNHRVIRFGRRGNISLHPATMLAALVWTLILASEEIVMILPENTDDVVEPLTQRPGLPEYFNQDMETAIFYSGTEELGDSYEKTPDYVVEQVFKNLLSQDISKMNQNTYAIGLSAIAVCLGFVTETGFKAVEDISPETILTLLNRDDLISTHVTLAEFDLAKDQTLDFLSEILEFLGSGSLSYQTPTENIVDSVTEEPTHLDTFLLNRSKETAIFDIFQSSKDKAYEASSTWHEKASETVVVDTGHDADHDEKNVLAAGPFISSGINVSQTNEETSSQPTDYALLDTFRSYRADIFEYTLTDINFISSFDITSDIGGISTDVIESAPFKKEVQNISISYEPFKNDALEFVIHLIENNDDIEFVSVNGEIILFDPSVLQAEPEDTVMLSWSLHDGDIISVIGLKSDYTSFDMAV